MLGGVFDFEGILTDHNTVIKTAIGTAAFIILYLSVGYGQSTTEDKVFVLPLAGYSSQFGFGGGANAAWLNIDGSSWQASAAAYVGSLYSLNFMMFDVINRDLFGLLYFDAGGTFYQNYRAFFYGLGDDTALANETQYSVQRTGAYAKLGVRFLDDFVIGGGLQQGTMSIDRGADPTIAQFLDQYGNLAYPSGLTFTFTQAFITYDTRKPITAPQEGDLVSATLSQSQPFQNETLAEQHLEIVAEDFLALIEKELILVTHLKYERTWGDNLPFFTQAPIGGGDTLRGYYVSRFIDFGSTTLNIEPRWSFWMIGGSFVKRFELSTAFEVGQVFDNGLIPSLSDTLHADVDFGFTVVFDGDIPVRFDLANSPESTLVYLNLFYPF